MSGRDLAQHAGLSAQTVSVMLRRLELDGLLLRGDPRRGKVGKPSVPMSLNAEGAFSIGLKIGRRSAEFCLMNLVGEIRFQAKKRYQSPAPDQILKFLQAELSSLSDRLPTDATLTGLGVCAPHEIWAQGDPVTPSSEDQESWRSVDLLDEIARLTDLPLFAMNDATAACHAETVFGRGRDFTDYGYFYVGAFIGGGVVMGGRVFFGETGNAGALGSLPSYRKGRKATRLLDTASLHLLESEILERHGDAELLWRDASDWGAFEDEVNTWIKSVAPRIAEAALATCAVIDFEAVVIDGAFPREVRRKLVSRVRRAILKLDTRGVIRPVVEEGSVGANARTIGAAYFPLASQFFLAAAVAPHISDLVNEQAVD